MRRRLPLPVAFVMLLAAATAVGAQTEPADIALVQAAYEGLLDREGEPAGVDYWADQLEAGVRPGDVIAAIGDAPERRQVIVRRLYDRFLGRAPEPAGLAFWSAGLIDRFSAESLAAELLGSEEFYLKSGGTDPAFVAAVYRVVLNRAPDAEGQSFWLGQLAAGRTRADVAQAISRSDEGLLQPDLSVEAASPAVYGTGRVDDVVVDLDRDLDAEASVVIVAVDGQRVPGQTTGDPNDLSVLHFTAFERPSADVGSTVVVTVFATDRISGTAFEVTTTDYSFTLGASAAPALPQVENTGDLLIAFYGHPRTAVLGVAGEGTPEQALARLQVQAAPYAVTGRRIVPTFEMISTLVTASPGEDGLYRSRAGIDELRPYLETIRTVNGELILDIQPGRADVEDEVRAYEELLLEPEVGIALDPEWVVGPGQTPQGRIGTLDAEAINRVSAYLSELAITNDLPPKRLIIHRFKPGMVTNTNRILQPLGVLLMFHADGEGGPAAKIADYDQLLPPRFQRGFKVFYDEDSPTMTPEQVLARTNPDPTFISYQ